MWQCFSLKRKKLTNECSFNKQNFTQNKMLTIRSTIVSRPYGQSVVFLFRSRFSLGRLYHALCLGMQNKTIIQHWQVAKYAPTISKECPVRTKLRPYYVQHVVLFICHSSEKNKIVASHSNSPSRGCSCPLKFHTEVVEPARKEK